jgi:hypothetical protein
MIFLSRSDFERVVPALDLPWTSDDSAPHACERSCSLETPNKVGRRRNSVASAAHGVCGALGCQAERQFAKRSNAVGAALVDDRAVFRERWEDDRLTPFSIEAR